MRELEPWHVSLKTAGNSRSISESELHFWTHEFLNTTSAKLKFLRNCAVFYLSKGREATFCLVSRNIKIKHLQRHKEKWAWRSLFATFILMKYGCEFCGLYRPFPAESYYEEPTRKQIMRRPWEGAISTFLILWYIVGSLFTTWWWSKGSQVSILRCFTFLLHRFILLPKQVLILDSD